MNSLQLNSEQKLFSYSQDGIKFLTICEKCNSDLAKYDKALEYCQRGYDISESIQSLLRKRASCSCLYDTYKAMGNGSKALHYLELLNAAEDSLDTRETAKKLQQMEFQAEARSIQEAHEEDIRQKEKTRNISYIVGAFFLLLAGSFYMRWHYVRKSRNH